MTDYSISDVLKGKVALNTDLQLNAWVRTRRDSKAGVSFLQIHDGSCFSTMQIVIPDSLENYKSEVLKLTAGCSVSIKGKLVASLGEGQSLEVHATQVTVIGWVENPDTYPMQAKRHTLEYLREVAHLRPRTNTIGAVSRIRHCAAQAIHRYFDQEGYFWVNTPIITASDCEGAGELFRISALDFTNLPHTEQGKVDFSKDFFGREAFLTVSGQLNAEAYALSLSKVYTFGPTFRAENSNTSRHLAEFWMVEPEIAFADLLQCAKVAEKLLKAVSQAVLNERADDMEFFAKWIEPTCIQRLEHIIEQSFEIMDYTEAVSIIQNAKKTFEFPISWGHDLQSEHERYIAEEYVKKPVVIMNYPKDIKSFYMRVNPDGKTVAAMDVLAPGIGEIIGGSQREERLNYLDQRLDEMQLNKEAYNWYRDLRRYGTVPHSGFGLGFERLLNYITGLGNIRDAIPFPRTPGNASY
jgi:asparaginyl-tRNA synthetase